MPSSGPTIAASGVGCHARHRRTARRLPTKGGLTMRRATVLPLILLLAAACQAPAPPPAAPSAPPSAPSAAAPSTSAAPDQWEQIVAAARREGRVIVTGPITAETQEAMTRGFEAKYPEIKVQYTGSSGAAVTPKIL